MPTRANRVDRLAARLASLPPAPFLTASLAHRPSLSAATLSPFDTLRAPSRGLKVCVWGSKSARGGGTNEGRESRPDLGQASAHPGG